VGTSKFDDNDYGETLGERYPVVTFTGHGVKIASQMLDKRKVAGERNITDINLLKLKFVTAIITNNNELYG